MKCDESSLDAGLSALESRLNDPQNPSGLTLVCKEDDVTLGTKPEASELIKELTKEELTKDLGKASLETLSIVLYKGPIARRQIDYIRGVNSNFILRNLMVRGLVEKIPTPNDQRSFLYKPTIDLLTLLGISKIDDLPEYSSMANEISEVIEAQEEQNNE